MIIIIVRLILISGHMLYSTMSGWGGCKITGDSGRPGYIRSLALNCTWHRHASYEAS